MSINLADYVAIGVTHSSETIHLLEEILSDDEFSFGAEGTMASGYECYVRSAVADRAIAAIKSAPKFHIEGHKIRFYDKPRAITDGTRYDRLLDEYCGENPDRPSADGIQFDL
ncbi:hypothetical protein [Haloferula rosea]|uniref:Uncharacterized protein n=1 Tax=Haloferula rosea TaxID=490093 RepID=A0A934VHW1_9BACT|nr:hypothetical protein [Haloferula rosea]MBK1829085.1 hypothetical protein [Haloferula rosea]